MRLLLAAAYALPLALLVRVKSGNGPVTESKYEPKVKTGVVCNAVYVMELAVPGGTGLGLSSESAGKRQPPCELPRNQSWVQVPLPFSCQYHV